MSVKENLPEYDRASLYCPVCFHTGGFEHLNIKEHNGKIYVKCFTCNYSTSFKGVIKKK